ncbi:Benzoate 4-monooxygenase [Mycena kentingensis (nom. inval.)]|nr:Benzoate 4-monooxygenase [Mycena kentingensis (nom. inval.)]
MRIFSRIFSAANRTISFDGILSAEVFNACSRQASCSSAVMLVALLGALGALLVALLLRKTNVPGPVLARWTPLWLAWHAWRGRRYAAVHEAHQRHGPIIRIAPNHISIASPAGDALSFVYAQGPAALPKSTFYDAFVANGKPSIFSTRDRQAHSDKRRLVSNAFSTAALKQFIPLIHARIERFAEKMDGLASEGGYFDALVWFNYLAFDILSDLAFGKAIGMVERGSDVVELTGADGRKVFVNAIALVDEREHFAAVVGIHPGFRYLARMLPFLEGNRATASLEDLARQHVQERLESGVSRDDILGKLIEARCLSEPGKTPTQGEIAELTAESVTLLIAGSDTTSNSIAVILHLIVTHPRVHNKLLDLLRASTAADTMDSDIDSCEYERARSAPYLLAAINEGLRLHSITAIGLPRVVQSGGDWFGGHYIPEGTEVSVPAWTICHDTELWGPDAHVFRPERWLEESEGRELKRYLMTFGKGPRACIGQNLAYIEITSVLAMILLRYKVSVQSENLQTVEGFMHKPVNCFLRLERSNGLR